VIQSDQETLSSTESNAVKKMKIVRISIFPFKKKVKLVCFLLANQESHTKLDLH